SFESAYLRCIILQRNSSVSKFTPARSVNEAVAQQSIRISTNVLTNVATETALGNGNVAWTQDIRPVSTHASFWPGTKFRLCAPFSHRGERVTAHGSGARFRNGNTENYYPGTSLWAAGNSLHNGVPTPTLGGSGLINKALVKALNRLKDQEFHLGNFLGEGRQTIDLIGGTVKYIARQVTQFRRDNLPIVWELVKKYERGSLPKELWNCIPNAWLQLQYGWIPLMSDVVGSANHLARLSIEQKPLVFTKGQAKLIEDVVQPIVSPILTANTASATWEREQKVFVNLVYGLNSPALVQLSQLGLINPAEIVWEVTRFSFVVDWFLPIGSWLSSLTGDVGYNFVTGGISRKTVARFKSSSIKTTSAGAQNVQAPWFTGDTSYFDRSCYTSSPVPGLYVKNPLSHMHALNAFSLLLQAFR
ncbi:TPA_asm: maturation protein, partial [ssRNA phage Gephyllon.3_5]